MSNGSVVEWLSRTHWQRWLTWDVFIFVVYELRDFFFVTFGTKLDHLWSSVLQIDDGSKTQDHA